MSSTKYDCISHTNLGEVLYDNDLIFSGGSTNHSLPLCRHIRILCGKQVHEGGGRHKRVRLRDQLEMGIEMMAVVREHAERQLHSTSD